VRAWVGSSLFGSGRGRHSTTVGRYDFTTDPAWPAELPAQLVSGLVSRWFMNGRWRELDGHGRQDEVLRVLQESRSIKILTASVYVRHRWKDLAVQTNSGARLAARVSSTPSGGAGRRNFGHSATARGGLRRMREWNRRAASAQANCALLSHCFTLVGMRFACVRRTVLCLRILFRDPKMRIVGAELGVVEELLEVSCPPAAGRTVAKNVRCSRFSRQLVLSTVHRCCSLGLCRAWREALYLRNAAAYA
jgi:hypothetical protein